MTNKTKKIYIFAIIIALFATLLFNFIPSPKSTTKTKVITQSPRNFEKITLVHEADGYKLENTTRYMDSEIKRVNKELKNAIAKVGGKENVKLSILNSTLSNFFINIGVEPFAVSNSPFLPVEILSQREKFNDTPYVCELFESEDVTYFSEDVAKEVVGPSADEGCYQLFYDKGEFVKTSYKFVPSESYKYENVYKYKNFGNPLDLNVEFLAKQGTNVVVTNSTYFSQNKAYINKIKAKGISVIVVDDTQLQDTFVLLETIGKTMTKDPSRLNYVYSEYFSTFEISKVLKNKIEQIKDEKILFVQQVGSKTFLLQPNSYIASWMKQLGFNYYYPEKTWDKNNDKVLVELESIKNIPNTTVVFIEHPINSHSVYLAKLEKNQKYYNATTKQFIYIQNLTSVHQKAPENIENMILKIL